MYKITRLTGRIYDAQDQEVPRDDRDDRWLAYVLWLSGDRTPGVIDEPEQAPDPAQVLEQARAAGRLIADGFMAQALAGGVNADPAQVSALYDWFTPLRLRLLDGVLHGALAEVNRLQATDPATRPHPALASNEVLDGIAAQIEGALL